MAHIWLTGNRDIDSATAEIAVTLRNACPVLCGDQDHYEQAAALRDQIMKGTRELDHDRRQEDKAATFLQRYHVDAQRILAQADDSVRRIEQRSLVSDGSADYDDSFTGPML